MSSITTPMQRHPQTAKFRITFANGAAVRRAAVATPTSTAAIPPPRSSSLKRYCRLTPEDADALAGMGYIAQRSGDYQAASQYLSRAADLGGDASATRRQQAADALFYGQLAQAQQAYKQGNISGALALSAPLAQQSGAQGASAKLFRADVLRHNKDLPCAENAALTVK